MEGYGKIVENVLSKEFLASGMSGVVSKVRELILLAPMELLKEDPLQALATVEVGEDIDIVTKDALKQKYRAEFTKVLDERLFTTSEDVTSNLAALNLYRPDPLDMLNLILEQVGAETILPMNVNNIKSTVELLVQQDEPTKFRLPKFDIRLGLQLCETLALTCGYTLVLNPKCTWYDFSAVKDDGFDTVFDRCFTIIDLS